MRRQGGKRRGRKDRMARERRSAWRRTTGVESQEIREKVGEERHERAGGRGEKSGISSGVGGGESRAEKRETSQRVRYRSDSISVENLARQLQKRHRTIGVSEGPEAC